MPTPVAPEEMMHIAEKITQDWLQSMCVKVVPYLVSDEWGDLWKYKIVSASYPDVVYASHLPRETADGILYKCIMQAYLRGHRAGVREGTLKAAQSAAMAVTNDILRNSGMPHDHIPDEVRKFMKSGFMPNPPKPLQFD